MAAKNVHEVVIKFTGNTTQATSALTQFKKTASDVGAELTSVTRAASTSSKKLGEAVSVTIAGATNYKLLRQSVNAASAALAQEGVRLDAVQYKSKAAKVAVKDLAGEQAKAALAAAKLAKAQEQAAAAAARTATVKAVEAVRVATVPATTQATQTSTLRSAEARTATAQATLLAASLRQVELTARAAEQSQARLNRTTDRLAAASSAASRRADAEAASRARLAAAVARQEAAQLRLLRAQRQALNATTEVDKGLGLNATHVLAYSAAYMAASATIMGAINLLTDIPTKGMAFEGVEAGLTGVYKNQALVADQLKFLSTLADDAGVKVETLRKSYVSFSASALKAGVDIEGANKQFENYTKTARALQLSDQDFQGMLTAIQQVLSKGRIMSEELQGQLGEHVPAAVAIMAESVGVSTIKLRKMMEQGELTSLQMQKFSDVLFAQFSQGYAQAVDGLSASTARFSNAWDELALSVYDNVDGILASVVKLGTEGLHWLNGLLDDTKAKITALDGSSIDVQINADTTGLMGALNRAGEGWGKLYDYVGGDKLVANFKNNLNQIAEAQTTIYGKFFGGVTPGYQSLTSATENAVQANAALSEGMKVLEKGSESAALVLRDELGASVKLYTDKANAMLTQITEQEQRLEAMRKSGQSTKADEGILAADKEAYQVLTGVLADYSRVYNQANTKILDGKAKAAKAINDEAKAQAEAIKQDIAATKTKKGLSDAAKQYNADLEKAKGVLEYFLTTQAESNVQTTQGAKAVAYLQDRIKGLTAAQAEYLAKLRDGRSLQDAILAQQYELANLAAGDSVILKAKVELDKAGLLTGLDFPKLETNVSGVVGDLTKLQTTFDGLTLKAEESAAAVANIGTVAYTASKGFDPLIAASAKATNIDPAFLKAILEKETGYLKKDSVRSTIVSPKGAVGVGQMLPSTGKIYGLSEADLRDPAKNIMAAAQHLKKLLGMFGGNETLAAAAYNAGENRASLRAGQVPKIAETQDYVKYVTAYAAKFRAEGQFSSSKPETQVPTAVVQPQPSGITPQTKAVTATGQVASTTPDLVKAKAALTALVPVAGNVTSEYTQAQYTLNAQAIKALELTTTYEKQLEEVRLTGYALAEQKLEAMDLGDEAKRQILTLQSAVAYESQKKALLEEAAQTQAQNNPMLQYELTLREEILTKEQAQSLLQQKASNLFEARKAQLADELAKAQLTEAAYNRREAAMQRMTALQAEILAQMEKEIAYAQVGKTAAQNAISGIGAYIGEALGSSNQYLTNFIGDLSTAILQTSGLQDKLTQLLTSASSRMGNGFSDFFSKMLGKLFRNGGSFTGLGVQAYANGDAFHNQLLTQPTFFMTQGKLAVAGEEGEEAVMPTLNGGIIGLTKAGKSSLPLTRAADGKLAVDLRGMQKYASGGTFGKAIRNFAGQESAAPAQVTIDMPVNLDARGASAEAVPAITEQLKALEQRMYATMRATVPAIVRQSQINARSRPTL